MKHLSAILLLWFSFNFAAQPDGTALKFGVLAFRPKAQTLAQWQPVAQYLQTKLGRPVELFAYDHAEMAAAVTARTVDVVTTTPNHFILLRHMAGISAPLATLVTREDKNDLIAYGGVIFARADRDDIASLHALKGKRIAATMKDAFGSYQMQAAEILEAGIPLPTENNMLFTGQPNDKVIEAVVGGHADVGFVRTGVIEALVRERKLSPDSIKIINRQDFPTFPYAVSTRLYPEWPIAVLPQVDRKLASHLAAALFMLPLDSTSETSVVAGFTPPANYDGVENLMRQLRLPPFDQTPQITLTDLWRRYGLWMAALASLLLLLAIATSGLVFLYRRSQQSLRKLERLTEKEKLILSSLAEGVYGVDTRGMCIFVNPSALNLLGYVESEVIGREAQPLFHANRHNDESATCSVTLTLRDGMKRESEDVFIRSDGAPLPISLASAAMRDGDTILGAVVVFQDITERKRIENALLRYKDELEATVDQRTSELRLSRDAAEAANKAKSLFLANMSHELRTPLNAILGFSRLMSLAADLPNKQRENLDIINRSGEHLLALINDVLEIAKIESGRLQLEIAPFDLGNLIDDISELMRLRAQQKGLSVKVEQASDFPRYILGDEARLRQILLNLVGNAVKFTEHGGVTIHLATKIEGRLQLIIAVEDTGPGIAAEDRGRIFDPFVQLSGKGSHPGTGLGLAITRQFVQLMGGRISLESIEGQGSCFRVTLPMELASAAEVSARGNDQNREIIGLAPGQPNYRILIAEDQAENQQLLKQLMEQLGLEVMIAGNGEQCIKLFQQWQPHLIWMDCRMPVMDGQEATRRIRGLPNGDRVKIVAVTASAFVEQRQEILAAGMNGFVRKPYHFDEIFQCLGNMLGLEFQYRADTEQSSPRLTPEMLAPLLPATRQTLREALQSLDSERVAEVLLQISECDQGLGLVLSRLADDFDYPTILKALDELNL